MASSDPEADKFSLWLCLPPPPSGVGPVEPQAMIERCAAWISAHAEQEDGKPAPAFDPHVTLIGGLGVTNGMTRKQVEDVSATLAASLAPLEIELGTIADSDVYFQTCYVVVNKTASLEAAFDAAVGAFGKQRHDFMPHLSLAYGSNTGDALRDQMVSECCRLDDATEGVSQGEANPRLFYENAAFTATTLAVWRTAGPVETWECVASFALEG